MLKWLYDEWMGIPDSWRAGIRSTLVSMFWTVVNVLYALYVAYTVLCDQTHAIVTFVGYLGFVKLSWGATAMGVLAAAYRVQQSNKKVQNTFVSDGTPLPAGSQYVLVKPAPGAASTALKPT